MVCKRLLLIALLNLIPLNSEANGQWHIFFDLPKTLLEPNETTFFTDIIGVGSGAVYTIFGGNPWKLEETMFRTLDTLGHQTVDPELFARSHKERVLPQIYCDVLNGSIRAEAAFDKVKHQIKKLDKEHFYNGKRERNLIIKIAQAIFSPQALADHTSIVNEGLELVQSCAQKHGTNRLYILANWDQSSMHMLQKASHVQNLMRNFQRDHIFISGTMKQLLPNPHCFERPIRHFHLNPQQCVFISGIPRHVAAAKKYGLKAVLIKKNNIHEAREELINLGVL